MTMASSSAAMEIGVPQLLNEGKSRTKDPGLRVVGGRIYDSRNGKTCHQCRQKTMDVMAPCKNLKVNNKPCPITYCHKCLDNRYGEKAEIVSQVDDWHCPKCRGICNCSLCMKKKGHQPTGILAHQAKKDGFKSVSELLEVKGPESFVYGRATKDKGASPKKIEQKLEPEIGSPRKLGKENSLDGNSDFPLNSQNEISIPNVKISEKTKREGLKEVSNANSEDASMASKKHRVAEETNMEEDPKIPSSDDDKASSENGKLLPIPQKEIVLPEIPLPQGSCLTEVAGVELCPEDVGPALQFLEFCNAFGQAFDLKKGHAEAVLRELVKGRRGCRSQSTLVIQIHIQLLSLIRDYVDERCPTLSPTDGQNSWLLSFGEFVANYPFMSKDFPPDCFGKGNEGYEELTITGKLNLLNFLCDEALNTNELRDIIEEQNIEFDASRKEAKAKILAAKDKEKDLKRKTQDEIAKAILAKNGAPLSISEHEALMSQIKMQTSQVHAEMLEAKEMMSKERSDAVRTAPMLLDGNGRAFWRLKSYNNQHDILLQDMGTCEFGSVSEKWFTYDEVQKAEVEKYVSSTRSRRKVRAKKPCQPLPVEKMEESEPCEPVPVEKMEESEACEPVPVEKMEESL
ncbi:Cell division cycle-associated 7-like protein [Linum perenne]